MSRSATLDLDPVEAHRLLGRAESARLLGMSPSVFDTYWRKHRRLVSAARATPDPRAKGAGTPHRKWPLHVLLAHIERDCRI